MSIPYEPLAESAPLAWAFAPEHCHRDPQTGETCVWYHQVWQYLRLLEVITTTRTNSDFLVGTIAEHARSGEYGRTLITGTADYSMLAHLACAYARARQPLAATVIDRCNTSLLLNRWYAERTGMALATACSDVLAYEADQPFDLITTHNFLSRFDDQARSALIARWHALLRRGGILVTTQRIHPTRAGRRSRFSDRQARELGARVAALARSRDALGVEPEELGQAVYEYALRKGGYVIRDGRQLTRAFAEGGFELLVADDGGGPAERARDRSSSVADPDSFRLRLVARRR